MPTASAELLHIGYVMPGIWTRHARGSGAASLMGDVMTLKALIAGVADMAHQPTEATDQEPIRRVCAYLEAAGAFLLVVLVAALLI